MGTDIIESILSCEDLYVILKNRWGEIYVESYQLPNILYSDGNFWGKFRNVHSAYGHTNIEKNQILSYAYNNFSNVVCTSGIEDRYQRYYSSYAYSSMIFTTRNKYIKIWESNNNYNNIEAIHSAIKNGLRLKILIESTDNYTYIVPISAKTQKDNFHIFSEHDGYPERSRYFDNIKKLSKYHDDLITPGLINDYPGTHFIKNSEFFLTSFSFNGSILTNKNINKGGKITEYKLLYKSIEIWCEEI
mgnify:CR=1 FL=1